ncbi:MAG: RCC1 domain-containing protein, partial [Polyangiales bacterium]
MRFVACFALLPATLLGGCFLSSGPASSPADGGVHVPPDAAPDAGPDAGPSPSAAPLVQIAVGGQHTCARDEEGQVWCWGAGDRGQIGDGATRDRTAPVRVLLDSEAVDIAAGVAHSCAVLTSGEVACWGDGGFGQLGAEPHELQSEPITVPDVGAAVEVSAGLSRTCARIEDGRVRCWGAGGSPRSPETGTAAPPEDIEGIADAAGISAGEAHTCAVHEGGGVTCWGLLRTESFEPSSEPVRLPGSEDIVRIEAASRAHDLFVPVWRTCGVDRSGRVSCWGSAFEEPTPFAATERSVSTLSIAMQPSTHGGCVVTTGGAVQCWDRARAATPDLRDVLTEGAVDVTVGREHRCALLRDGTARCWGSNLRGALGIGLPAYRASPVSVDGFDGASRVAAGRSTTCAVRAGSVWCWG